MLTMQREFGSLLTPCNEESESMLPYTHRASGNDQAHVEEKKLPHIKRCVSKSKVINVHE